jgi:branched-chain amino acid transport system substrate-binding protein
VIWYGSDSVAQSADLIEDEVAAAYAAGLTYPNPILGLRDEDRSLWEPVLEEVEDDLDRAPDTFALAAYDALVVAHKAFKAAGTDATADELGAALVTAAEAHVGLTGPAVLNDAGDRASASFDFWSVCEDGDAYVWVRTINYAPDPEGGDATITRDEC